jgi:hypothetical protein
MNNRRAVLQAATFRASGEIARHRNKWRVSNDQDSADTIANDRV